MVCTFFGHRDCYGLDRSVLCDAIVNLIRQGVTEFLVGHQGQFDGMVFSCLRELEKEHPHIQYAVVLAYLPSPGQGEDFYQGHRFYPEGQEIGPARFAIERRNRYLIASSDICLCYVNHTFGGAYKFARMAKTRGLQVINLGSAVVEGNSQNRKSK